jgi:hypothetical protein
MNSVTRGFVTILTAISSFCFTFWMGGALLLSVSHLPEWVVFPMSGVVALGAAAFVWSRSAMDGGFVNCVCKGAVVTGAIAFALGFFGPMMLTPGANQGPMLGLFITGPLGFVAGGVGGGVRWVARRLRA